jgi:hypothetical protein
MTKQKNLTYKQLVKGIRDMNGEDEFNILCSCLDRSFEAEKITWEDHETLYDIACWAYKSKRGGGYVRFI